MSTLSVRIPDSKHARLRLLARSRGITVNRLMDELTTAALAQYDAEVRFRALASEGSVKRGLDLLDQLDRHFRAGRRRRQAG